jgi:hypothetical protein
MSMNVNLWRLLVIAASHSMSGLWKIRQSIIDSRPSFVSDENNLANSGCICLNFTTLCRYMYNYNFVEADSSIFAFNVAEIALQCFSETYLSRFGEHRHSSMYSSVTSGDVGAMWMSPTQRVKSVYKPSHC